MTDELKESLSALIDGEASEIEVHRLLRRFDSDEGLKPAWIRYLQLRAVVRGENLLTARQHLELHQQITRAIVEEEAYADAPGMPESRTGRRYLVPAAGFAVAASMLLAVFVVFNLQTPESGEMVDASPVRINNTQPVSLAQTSEPVEQDQLELKELDEEKQRQLRAYLNQHDRLSRMNPDLRTVIFDESNGN